MINKDYVANAIKWVWATTYRDNKDCWVQGQMSSHDPSKSSQRS